MPRPAYLSMLSLSQEFQAVCFGNFMPSAYKDSANSSNDRHATDRRTDTVPHFIMPPFMAVWV